MTGTRECVVFGAALALVFGTLLSCGRLIGVNYEKANEIRESIAVELQVGASADQIERFFESKSIVYSYQPNVERYHGIIRDVGPFDQAISIYINVDDERKFLSAEVHDTFTAP